MSLILPIIVFLPIIAGLILLCVNRINPKALKLFVALVSFANILLAISVFNLSGIAFGFTEPSKLKIIFGLATSPVSSFIALFACVMAGLIFIYSFKYFEASSRINKIFGYMLVSLGAACGAALSVDYFSLLVFWGILGFTLYMLLNTPPGAGSAKKAFVMIGGTDVFMVLGIGIVFLISKSFLIGAETIPINSWITFLAYIFIFLAAAAKSAIFPLHTWLPDAAPSADTPTLAMLPATLDKLLGIYLLWRMNTEIFSIRPGSIVSIIFLAIASFTIIIGVLMALVQHNQKKLLAYHIVSQTGYMALGISTGTVVGIAGGMLHMINHVIYKTCLLLSFGATEKQAGTDDLDRLGGLIKFMPATFLAALFASLAISGIPPFNGFISKWLIYQGVIEVAKVSPLWIIWLVAAMFGSALTLASFMKLLHATFLADQSNWIKNKVIKESPAYMLFSMLFLAGLTLVLGIFAFVPPVSHILSPIIGPIMPQGSAMLTLGLFSPLPAALLLLSGLMLGVIVYGLSNLKNIKEAAPFIGGEKIAPEITRISGTNFYNTISQNKFLEKRYKQAKNKLFDVYYLGSVITFTFSIILKWIHNGLLNTYIVWALAGLGILLILLVR